jgi:hypothetical protein
MKLSMRKSESQNGIPEGTAVIRQPKGPEAQGVKGFGRQMSRKTGDSSSNESSSEENREKIDAMTLDDQESDADLENEFKGVKPEAVNGHEEKQEEAEVTLNGLLDPPINEPITNGE